MKPTLKIVSNNESKPKLKLIDKTKIFNDVNILFQNLEIKEDEWKEILPKYPGYWINKKGEVKGKRGELLTSHINLGGYKIINIISYDNRQLKESLHRLLALIFIPNPENKKYVDHINRNKLDNHISNLRWCTATENNSNRTLSNMKGTPRKVIQLDLDDNEIKIWDSMVDITKELNIPHSNISKVCSGERQTAGGFKWKYVDYETIEGEEWKDLIIDDITLGISSHGRIYTVRNFITYGYFDDGYMRFHINKKQYSVHRLVCLVFDPIQTPENYVVNHIDGNKTNNHYLNLEWTTQSDNIIKAHDIGLIERRKKVIQYTLDGDYIQSFESLTSAEEKTCIGKSEISKVCKNKQKTAGGYIWKYADQE